MDFQQMDIYQRIKHLRKKELNITQEDFASSLGVSRSNIGNIEVGRINVTERVIQDICSRYNVNESWLRNGIGDIFLKSKNTILDELAKEQNLNSKEKAIIQAFLDLSPQGRAGVLEYVDKLVGSIAGSVPSRDEQIAQRIADTNKMIENAAKESINQ